MPSTIRIDADGRIYLPEQLLRQIGLYPQDLMRLERSASDLTNSRSMNQRNQIYTEPTNACNLTCFTCMRNVWDEPLGFLSEQTFKRILDGLRACQLVSNICIGGFGKPLFHPGIQTTAVAAFRQKA